MYHNYHFVSDAVFGNQYTQPDAGYIEPLLELFPGCVLDSNPRPKNGPIGYQLQRMSIVFSEARFL